MAKEKIKTNLIILIIGGLLFLGIFFSYLTYKITFSFGTKDIDKQTKSFQEKFAEQVAGQNNANKLASDGLRQINSNLLDMAKISLNRATAIDRDYRDAWLVRALAEYNTSDFSAALLSAKTAEKLDPINPKTYELLKEIYIQSGNLELASSAEKKLEFLLAK